MRKTTIKLPILDKEVEVCAPTVRVIRAAASENNPEIKGLKIVAACVNMADDELNDLEVTDFLALQEAVESFLPQNMKLATKI
ncbi:phage tail assembly protein [Campylobacter hyointestinalis subsp. hyointestinalis]|uniref:phage tail assembly protein n=1 Tax=Campylobacter hyointestinalis TaxID=198 RepID=UPI000727B232|nr:phage tail assembly protein [Campylobacter hyointestinalis]PPB57568.1 phage tail assembly protein [Campylobacter hyointestinalis subsp. hyointestinalis]QCT99372.1 phage tail assembly protein [Campylobacter hyointestinalis subsp. hyointestinalis]CUU82460.1 Uncharacterised protein [Campylobacter hyointestinalis subsp. hyointestinalis]